MRTTTNYELRELNTLRAKNHKRHLSNFFDNGGRGRAFEVFVNWVLAPLSQRVNFQPTQQHDCKIVIDGVERTVEIKTGQSNLIQGVDPMSYDDVVNSFDADYVVYLMSYTDDIETAYTSAAVLPKARFFQFIEGYTTKTGKKTQPINYVKKSRKYRMVNPNGNEHIKKYYTDGLTEFVLNNDDCFFLDYFAEMNGCGLETVTETL